MKISIKYYPQHTDYTCGPACLRMIFEHLGKKYSEKKLAKLCKTSSLVGTNHDHLIEEIVKEKFAYITKTNCQLADLIQCVEAGYPALINYIEPLTNRDHYAIVTGYTDDKKSIILADPCNGNDLTIPYINFKKRWHNTNKSSKGWLLIIGRESISL